MHGHVHTHIHVIFFFLLISLIYTHNMLYITHVMSNIQHESHYTR